MAFLSHPDTRPRRELVVDVFLEFTPHNQISVQSETRQLRPVGPFHKCSTLGSAARPPTFNRVKEFSGTRCTQLQQGSRMSGSHLE